MSLIDHSHSACEAQFKKHKGNPPCCVCTTEELKSENARYRAAFTRIGMAAGLPDPRDACRAILKIAQAALEGKP